MAKLGGALRRGILALTGRLRREPTMTLQWIAEHLAMGSASNVANLLAASRTSATKR